MAKRVPDRDQPKLTERDDASESPAESGPRANGEMPTHREDFMRFLNAAVRKPGPKD